MTAVQEAGEETRTIYTLDGTLIEACSCNVNCPCWIGEDPDLGECFAIVAYGIERGQIRELDVSGLSLVLICHIPGNVLAGNWQVVALVDESATQEQRDALLEAFTGKLGGPLGDLWTALIGEVKGVEFVPITHEVDGGSGDPAHPRSGRDGDGALPRPGRQRDHPAELRLLDRPRLPRLDRQGEREPGEPAAVRHDVGVRGPERDPVRVEDGARWMTAIASALERPRGRVPRPVLLAIAAGWALAVTAELTGTADALHHDTLIEGGSAWAALLFLLAWQAMVAAMMLPSALPLIRLFDAVSRNQERPWRARGAFLAGYGAVWTGFGALALLGDSALHHTVDAIPWLSERPWFVAGGVLALAGAFQFSDLKDQCLSKCRQPGPYLLAHYRRGPEAGFRLGFGHGLFCLGCCWALMLRCSRSARPSISTILPRRDREAHDRERPAAGGATTTPAAPFTSAGRTNGEAARTRSPARPRPARREPRTRRRGADAAVGSQHDVRVEHRDQRLEVAVAGGGEEGVDDFALAGEIGVGHRGRSLHPAPRAARELPRRGRGAPDDGRDLVERHAEHVVQHEREPLGGRQRLEHDEQREPDRVGQQRLVLGVDPVRRGSRSDRARARRAAPRGATCASAACSGTRRATTVVSQPPRFSTPLGVGAAEPQPGFLDGVVGLAQRAEHPVGHRPQVGPVLLEPFRQPARPSVTFLRCRVSEH